MPYPQIALALLGAWSIFPPYVGPVLGLELNVAAKVEVVDHVVPGVSIALCAALAALLARRGAEAEYGTPALVLGGVCFLGGLWQAATHAPLVFDAGASAPDGRRQVALAQDCRDLARGRRTPPAERTKGAASATRPISTSAMPP